MLRSNRMIGAILLIAGTSIGGGMLAIPVFTGFAGFYPSVGLLLLTWAFMLVTAFLFLEATIYIRKEVNMVTMAEKTLGSWGKAVSWITYLLLMYSLTAAYIAASAPMFLKLFHAIGIAAPSWIGPLPLLGIFGLFIYLGTKSVDYVNRILMFGLLLGYCLLVIIIPSQIDFSLFTHFDPKSVIVAVPVLITAFGYHIIIPSLTTYMHYDKKRLQKAIVIGSLIPIIIYLLWEFLVLGTIPLKGENGLISAWVQAEPATTPLMNVMQNRWIGIGAYLFAFFAVITSFIGVSLSLADFLRDGLKIKRTGSGRLIACILTFLPPLFFVYSYPRGFYLALQYAAIFVAILLCIMPALMTWTLPKPSPFRSVWGRVMIVIVLLISAFIILTDIAEETGYIKIYISHYLK